MGSYSNDERELHQTLVYCGAPSSGKTCNVRQVQSVLDPDSPVLKVSGEQGGVWIEARSGPIQLPLDPPLGVALTVQTVCGDIDQNRSWREILATTDGIVFVVDAQRHRLRDNLIAWADLLENLRAVDRDPYQLPMVVQYNKMDQDNCMDPADLASAVNPEGFPSFEASAIDGRGVGKCFSEVVRRMVARAHTDLDLDSANVARGPLASAMDAMLARVGSRASQRTVTEQPIEAVTEPLPSADTAEQGVEPALGTTASEGAVAEPQDLLGPGAPDRGQRERDLFVQLWKREREASGQAVREVQGWARATGSVMDDAERAGRSLQLLFQAVEADGQLTPSLADAMREGGALVQYLASLPRAIDQQASGDTRTREEEVDLSEPFQAAVQSLAAATESLGMRVVSPRLPRVHGDPLLLQAVFRELLFDAVHTYCADDRTLRVGVRCLPGHCLVSLQGPFGAGDWGSFPVVRELLEVLGGQLHTKASGPHGPRVVVQLPGPETSGTPERKPEECVQA